MGHKNFIRWTAISFLIFLVSTFSWNRSFASSREIKIQSTEISRILSALEDDQIGGPELREKIRGKLSTLNHEQILLIATLSERIAKENRTAERGIAILLITALIVFS